MKFLELPLYHIVLISVVHVFESTRATNTSPLAFVLFPYHLQLCHGGNVSKAKYTHLSCLCLSSLGTEYAECLPKLKTTE